MLLQREGSHERGFSNWSAECHMLFLYGYKYTYKD